MIGINSNILNFIEFIAITNTLVITIDRSRGYHRNPKYNTDWHHKHGRQGKSLKLLFVFLIKVVIQ